MQPNLTLGHPYKLYSFAIDIIKKRNTKILILLIGCKKLWYYWETSKNQIWIYDLLEKLIISWTVYN